MISDQSKAHKIDTMDNESIIQTVKDEMEILTNKQIMLMKYTTELEDRRHRFIEFIKNRELLKISTEARENLLVNVEAMEINVVRAAKIANVKGVKEQSNKKCRYNNVGYCKMGTDCVYNHSNKVCDEFLTTRCPDPKSCSYRHPKECKFWLGDPRGCLRGQECKYLHKMENKGRHIKTSEGDCNIEDISNRVLNKEDKTIDKDINISNNSDKDNIEEMVIDMEEKNSPKDDIITSLRNNSKTLETENRILTQQIEKLKRVVTNMNKHIQAKEM